MKHCLCALFGKVMKSVVIVECWALESCWPDFEEMISSGHEVARNESTRGKLFFRSLFGSPKAEISGTTSCALP